MAAIAAALLVFLGMASTATAASYAKGVYAPHDRGDFVEGWADVNTDCEGTFGCSAFVQLEFRLDNPARPYWMDHAAWEFGAGKQADGGWNKLTVPYKGCGAYRMVVFTSNEAPGEAVFGINLGPASVNIGGGVKQYNKVTRSGDKRICHLA